MHGICIPVPAVLHFVDVCQKLFIVSSVGRCPANAVGWRPPSASGEVRRRFHGLSDRAYKISHISVNGTMDRFPTLTRYRIANRPLARSLKSMRRLSTALSWRGLCDQT